MVLLLVNKALGSDVRGAQLAIRLPGGFNFQSSEFGKVLLALALAGFIVGRARRIGERDTTARVMLLALVPAVIVMAQPDLGSALVYILIPLAMLFVAGAPVGHFCRAVALGGGG